MKITNSIQFGEGNFIRAFVDYCIQLLNEQTKFKGKIHIIQPIEKGKIEFLKKQKGRFHVFSEGKLKKKLIRSKKIIDCIDQTINPYTDYESFIKLSRDKNLTFIFSNTTESGINFDKNDSLFNIPPKSFPGKLTVFLYERFKFFNADINKTLNIIPCELIENNGDQLKKIILQLTKKWKLENKFYNWVKLNKFYNSLVDRIVPGFPKKKLNYYKKQLDFKDDMIVTCEPFFLWIIEGDKSLEKIFPVNKIRDIDVKIINEIGIFKTRKIRILNGSHTIMVSVGLIMGIDNVYDFLKNKFLKKILTDTVKKEIIPSINYDSKKLLNYFFEIKERFENPYFDHKLKAISLNSITKFKSRLIPSIIQYTNANKKTPINLLFILSCLIVLYYKRENYDIKDSISGQHLFDNIKTNNRSINTDSFSRILSNKNFWGVNLLNLYKLKELVLIGVKTILFTSNLKEGYKNYINKVKLQ